MQRRKQNQHCLACPSSVEDDISLWKAVRFGFHRETEVSKIPSRKCVFCPKNVCCVDIFKALGMENMNIGFLIVKTLKNN